MTISAASQVRLFAITHANAIPTMQHDESSALQKALTNYQAKALSNHQAASMLELTKKSSWRDKPVLDFTLEGVGRSVLEFGDGTRNALDDIASKFKGFKIQRIKIDGYDPILGMLGGERADAVKSYLSVKGVDQNLMWSDGHWRKPWDPDFKLADRHCVVIKVYGQPKIGMKMMSV